MHPLSGFSTTLDSGASLANAKWVRERWLSLPKTSSAYDHRLPE
jgi:hypothetical protein